MKKNTVRLTDEECKICNETYNTPKRGNWLKIAENELSAMTRQCLSGRSIGHIETLRDEIAVWAVDGNTRQPRVD